MIKHTITNIIVIFHLLIAVVSSQGVPVGAPFPFTTGVLKDTNSCSQNYKTGCATACKGDLLTFSGCDGDRSQDTYFKLYLGNVMVAHNDDFCNSVSYIQYAVNTTGCNQYCLRMGCFGLASCSANVTGTRISSATASPTALPTKLPTLVPTKYPTSMPSSSPMGGRPSGGPTSMPTSFPSGQPTIITVDNVGDSSNSTIDTANCYSTLPTANSGNCDLRTAWTACAYLVPMSLSKCIIKLPDNATIQMNSVEYGALIMTEEFDVQIQGGVGSEIRGQIGGPIDASPVQGSDFPVSTGVMTDTASDTQNYETACTIGCTGDILTFSACDGDTTQDTYFKLLLNESVVDSNDDYCGSSSYIQYTVTAAGCNDFCLHIGCFGSTSCSANVTATIIPQAEVTPRFIYYLRNNSQPASLIPKLSLMDITIESFGGMTFDGGVLYLNGLAEVQLQSVTFNSNNGQQGGVVYVSHNSRTFQVQNCTFLNNTAVNGGGFCLQSGVNSFSITDSHFWNSTAMVDGGGVYIATYNKNVIIQRSTFILCNAIGLASATGGAISMDSYNDNFMLSDSAIDSCYSTFYGGGFASLTYNMNSTVSNANITNCDGAYGGGVFIGTGSYGLNILNTNVDNCNATVDGGGIYLYVELDDVVISNAIISNSYAGNDGGGIFIFQYCDNFKLQNSIVRSCGAGNFGGGLASSFFNVNSQVTNTVFESCVANGYGGGLHAQQGNNNFLLTNSIFDRCSAINDGGGLRFASTHTGITIDKVSMIKCSGSNGGSMHFDSDNAFTTIMNSVFDRSSLNGNDNVGKGTALMFNSLNSNTTLTNITIKNCASIAAYGGGLYFGDFNSVVDISNSSISNCSAAFGGGMHLGDNNGFVTISSSSISKCNAFGGYGGGLSISKNNENVQIIESSITKNYAEFSGGGIYSNYNNTGLTLAGSQCSNNTAGYMGAGFHVVSAHQQLLVIDSEGYRSSSTLQSEHPYKSDYPSAGGAYVIYSKTVTVPNAYGFIINFDSKTEINTELDKVTIYDSNSKASVLFSSSFSATVGALSTTVAWPGVNVPSLHIDGSTFYIEFTGPLTYFATEYVDNFYGFKLYSYPLIVAPAKPTVVNWNTATNNGGGIVVYSGNSFPVIISTTFSANKAKSAGALFLRDTNNGATVKQVTFSGNKASFDGAAMVIYTTNYGFTIQDSIFTGNTADRNGGAMNLVTGNGVGILLYGNEIMYNNCVFTNNNAFSGGAFYSNGDNSAIFSNCAFEINVALANIGGGVALNQDNNISFINSTLNGNSAYYSGGGIASSNANTIYISNVTFNGNVAGLSGGSLSIAGETKVYFSGLSVFRTNYAGYGGGAIISVGSPLWTLAANSSIVLDGNSARTGSAMFFKSLLVDTTTASVSATSATVLTSGSTSTADSLHDMVIMNNVATVGGTVFWVYDSSMISEPPGINSNTISWSGNYAPYGTKITTQATQILGPQKYEVTVYSQSLSPPIVFQLYDAYGLVIPQQGVTSVVASIDYSQLQCRGQTPSLSGNDMFEGGVHMDQGKAEFAELEAYCTPRGNLTVVFEALLGDLLPGGGSLAVIPYYIKNSTWLTFRSCIPGEKYTLRECVECPWGSYSLLAGNTECTNCLDTEGISECYANQIVVSRGYWRRFNHDTEVLRCPLFEACAGGNGTGDALCAVGYSGPLCSVCADNFFSIENVCVACQDDKYMTPTLVGYVTVVAILLVVAVALLAFKYKYFLKDLTIDDVMDDEQGELPPVSAEGEEDESTGNQSIVKRVYMFFKKNFVQVMSKAKIAISTFQIVTSASTVLAVQMPGSFTSFVDVVNFLNLNLTSALPISCAHTFNFIDHLVWITLAPIALTCCLVVLFVLEYSYHRKNIQANKFRQRGEKAAKFNEMRLKYLSYFFYLTYLVLPSVTTTIFEIFPCTNVDPTNEDQSNSLFLTADMSVSCTSDYYYEGVAYACIMIFVYPIGIPLLYFILLYSNRLSISNRDGSKDDEAGNIGSGGGDSAANESDRNSFAALGRIFGDRVSNHITENPMLAGLAEKDKGGVRASDSSNSISSRASEEKRMAADLYSVTSEDAAKSLKAIDEKTTKANMNLISFLWASYSPEYWYWECIETTRRLMLTSVLSVCWPGTSSQGVLALLFALSYIKIYGYHRPYMRVNDNTLAEVGQFQIFFTFFGALIIQNDLLGSNMNELVGVSLLLINLTFIFFVIFFVFYSTTMNKGDENERPSTSAFVGIPRSSNSTTGSASPRPSPVPSPMGSPMGSPKLLRSSPRVPSKSPKPSPLYSSTSAAASAASASASKSKDDSQEGVEMKDFPSEPTAVGAVVSKENDQKEDIPSGSSTDSSADGVQNS